jgi:hypothetical protein
VPRPIEIEFKVSLFVQGGSTPGMDAPLKLAQDFEEYLEQNMVDSAEFARRRVLAVEVKPHEVEKP